MLKRFKNCHLGGKYYVLGISLGLFFFSSFNAGLRCVMVMVMMMMPVGFWHFFAALGRAGLFSDGGSGESPRGRGCTFWAEGF